VTDILNWMMATPNFESHLESSDGQAQCFWLDYFNRRLWYPKTLAGGPGFDCNTFDENYVYQSITELDWNDPHHFKMFASTTRPHQGNGGIAWAPRYIDASSGDAPPPPLVSDSTYRLYASDDCKTYTVENLGGPVTTQVYLIGSYDFGGDLGRQYTLKLTYLYTGVNMEVFYYATSFGWVGWERWLLVNGQWVQQQSKMFNLVKPGPLTGLNFPCAIPVIG
jgi:hypothetical protein